MEVVAGASGNAVKCGLIVIALRVRPVDVHRAEAPGTDEREDDDETANRQYIKHIVLDFDSIALRGVPSDRELGRRYGVEWAEAFHYIGPTATRLGQLIGKNAVPL